MISFVKNSVLKDNNKKYSLLEVPANISISYNTQTLRFSIYNCTEL